MVWFVPELVDRQLRVTARIEPLKLHRTEIARRLVAARVIVKADVVDQVVFRLVVVGTARQVHPRSSERQRPQCRGTPLRGGCEKMASTFFKTSRSMVT